MSDGFVYGVAICLVVSLILHTITHSRLNDLEQARRMEQKKKP